MKGLKDKVVTSNPALSHSHALLSPFLLPVSVLKLDFPPLLPVGHQTAIGTPPWSSDGRGRLTSGFLPALKIENGPGPSKLGLGGRVHRWSECNEGGEGRL